MALFFQGITKEAPNEYVSYLLCEKFGWTYQELMSQPTDFIDGLLLTMNIEKKSRNWQQKSEKIIRK